MIISYSNGITAFVQSKTVVLYYYFCEIANQFLIANTVTLATRENNHARN